MARTMGGRDFLGGGGIFFLGNPFWGEDFYCCTTCKSLGGEGFPGGNILTPTPVIKDSLTQPAEKCFTQPAEFLANGSGGLEAWGGGEVEGWGCPTSTPEQM